MDKEKAKEYLFDDKKSLKSQEDIRIDRAAEEYVVKGGLQPEAFIVIPAFKAGAEWMAGNSTGPSINVYSSEVEYLSEIIEDASRGIYLDNQLINYLCSLKSRIANALE
jgi:hypothetical protein